MIKIISQLTNLTFLAAYFRFLNHPNLVQLFGVVLKKRPIMIITEYMKYGKSPPLNLTFWHYLNAPPLPPLNVMRKN